MGRAHWRRGISVCFLDFIGGYGMKYEIDHDLLFEIVQCIVSCSLDVEEAFDYAVSTLNEDVEDADYE